MSTTLWENEEDRGVLVTSSISVDMVWCQSLCGPDWHTMYLIMPIVLVAVFVLAL